MFQAAAGPPTNRFLYICGLMVRKKERVSRKDDRGLTGVILRCLEAILIFYEAHDMLQFASLMHVKSFNVGVRGGPIAACRVRQPRSGGLSTGRMGGGRRQRLEGHCCVKQVSKRKVPTFVRETSQARSETRGTFEV
ncbi:hypothetical protein ANO11243_095990 [Dothideomycetidae sp. 11243]|nr:hypothetical protein ANO11243_095990 [fungal sp. No.11243]